MKQDLRKDLEVEKLALHNMIIQTDNKDLYKLEVNNYETVLKRLKFKNKTMYKHIKKAGKYLQVAMYKYYKPLVNLELVPETYNYTKYLVSGKGKEVS